MSAAERTNDSAMKSAPSSAASARSVDVLLGDRRQLRPRVGDVDALARATAGRGRPPARPRRAPSTRSTAKRGTPSPITSCERSVTSAASLSNATGTPSAVLPGATNRTMSPTATVCALDRPVQPQLRALEVEQHAHRPARPARAASRTSAARRRRSSGSPCEQFSRAQLIPAAISASSASGASVAGPERRHDLRPSFQHCPHCAANPS